jgi:hypothetical protein
MSGLKIDEWLPECQVSARYSLLVGASVEQTYAALTKANFSDLAIVRGLMRLRGYRLRHERATASNSQRGTREYGSFLLLATVAEQEVLLGIAGRFWRPDGGIVAGLTPEEFRGFHRDGYAKAVWNFSLAAGQGGTQLSTETRVQTLGRAATMKFRLYWLVVGPFSGLMRKAMLREIKRIAERLAG